MASYSDDLVKTLPCSVEAEQALLGSILINPESINDIAGIVNENDFYIESHKLIFSSMKSLFLKNKSIDTVTIINELVSTGNYNDKQAKDYIILIADSVPTAANVKDYAEIVKSKSMLRLLIESCNDILETAYTEHGDFSHIIDSAEQKIFNIAQGHETKGFEHIRDAILREYEHLNLLRTDKAAITGVSSGFSALDSTLIGMTPGDLIILGARPGVGKTSLALNIAVNVAKSSNKAVAIFSLEMSNLQLVERLLSMEALVDSRNLRTGMLSQDEWDKIADASAMLSGCDILLDDTTDITITGMKAKLRRVKNLGFAVIDYIGLMQGDRKSENRATEIGEISRNMKILAKELGIPLLVLAQLNRDSAKQGRPPQLVDLRDSGSIEQDADVVMFIHQDDKPENYNKVSVIFAKNRHGMANTVELGWFRQFTKYTSIEQNMTEN